MRAVAPFPVRKFRQIDSCYISCKLSKILLVMPPITVQNLRSMGHASCSLILPPLFSRILSRCFIFDYYNIIICKKGKVKDETSEINRETNGGQISNKMSHYSTFWPQQPPTEGAVKFNMIFHDSQLRRF